MKIIRKVHKMHGMSYKVLCGQDNFRLRSTENDKEVTCTLCVRKILGLPRLGAKKLPTRRKHIRRADSYLGLLRG